MAKYADVIVDIEESKIIDRPFVYFIPRKLRKKIKIGSRVVVPFRKKQVVGYVIGFRRQTEVEEVKRIQELLEERPFFNRKLLELAKWLAKYYYSPLIEVIRCLLPEKACLKRLTYRLKLKACQDEIVELKQKRPAEAKILGLLKERGELDIGSLKKELTKEEITKALSWLKRKGVIEEQALLVSPKVVFKLVPKVRLVVSKAEACNYLDNLQDRAPKQAAILEVLIDSTKALTKRELLKAAQASSGVLGTLVEKGIVEYFTVEAKLDKSHLPESRLTAAEQEVVDLVQSSVAQNRGDKILLSGINENRRRAIYLEAIDEAINKGYQAITLVPEIYLTENTAKVFQDRFGERLVVLHSRLPLRERCCAWQRIIQGAVDVVLGVRGAIFVPVNKLGLVIVDEEHEPYYKNIATPRYNVREVALQRATLENATLLMGSMTPSVETFYRARRGKFQLINLADEVEMKRPKVEIVDMRAEGKWSESTIFSRRLKGAINHLLAQRQQMILFLNRRGFANFMLCQECGFVMRCPKCYVAFTLHLRPRVLYCHHCGFIRKLPTHCPNCAGFELLPFGVGTEKLEEVTRQIFSGCKVLRLDSDVASKPLVYQSILDDFKAHRADVLIGTQMVAKDLALPGVTLVGVVSADTGLHFPDFRAAERTFQLLTQLIGQVSNGNAGRVIVQTFNPRHYSILAAQKSDFFGFYQEEIKYRHELGYPPFCRLVNLTVTGEIKEQVREVAHKLGDALSKVELGENEQVEVLGPAPSPIWKLKGKYRWHVVLKARKLKPLHKAIDFALAKLTDKERARLIIDVDPVAMV